ncbi:helix-turn-helix domain containing protein [Providencia sp. PROV188]|uniref:helix-turn-helix domain-containing protein n=1 Tax=Providencia sp. PROV188 TaxID=2939731 RepID=UPI0022DD059E|nr:helix-turn-helix domain-containing protein [Providencia sp. PROV188]WBM60747.1 helix-turn-helix domain containing protein [Providencia sp. PROV188]
MSKHSRNSKIIIANQCLSGESSRSLSAKYSISHQQIQYWSKVIAIHDNNAFLPTPHLRCVTARFQALKLIWTNGWSITHTSSVLNLIYPGTLFVWLNRYNEKGFSGLECEPRKTTNETLMHNTNSLG